MILMSCRISACQHKADQVFPQASAEMDQHDHLIKRPADLVIGRRLPRFAVHHGQVWRQAASALLKLARPC